MKPKIIIDCDPGHDDAIAIMMAARLTEILGITTVSGNAPLDLTTDNALLLTELVALDVEVHAGAEKPLLLPPRHAEEAHGKTGLDGPSRPSITRSATSSDAVRFIIDTIRHTDEVWLVPIGPLTNIALAVQQAPDIVERVAGISIMGGSATAGNVTATAEFNVWADPHAASIVFNAGFERFRMAGLNLTHKFGIDEQTIRSLRDIDNQVAVFAAELFDFYLASYQKRTSGQRVPLHDPCAVLAVTHPELFEFKRRNVTVETEGAHTQGMTVIDQRGWGDRPLNCEVAYEIDRDQGMQIFLETMDAYTVR
jgi:inosine-uridine nucleoside N-ribohydrolase